MTTTATQTRTRLIREMLQAFDFRRLFNQLGWDHYNEALTVEVGGVRYTLRGVSEKRGLGVFVCEAPAEAPFPERETRLQIERQVAKSVFEHLIIYVDSAQTRQVWQWARREHGKPTAVREHRYFKGQVGENIAQRLNSLFVSLSEEENLTGQDVRGRAAQAFDVDRVTKKFYDRFKTEHAAFLARIAGIGDEEARAWYASLMLNRLMFTYFIQKKGFLAGDEHYLRNKLAQVRARYGEGQFHSFYRSFLLRLFHEGLGQPKTARDAATAALIGEIPYLNGGLFEVHQIERDHPEITIPDEAFERVFAFFDSYIWHLDTEHQDEKHPDNEINPDVLGYIFEKYINQKQMGAYYTKEDITEYIGKHTILPFVLEQARVNCKVAFERPESEVWRLLSEDPDRYIYPAVLHGVDLPLPDEIATGVDDVARRGGWNRPADPDYALPTETWREHVARRTRCLDLRAKLLAGEVTAVNDLITYNLDIRRFAQDVIENCEGPDLLRALWDALSTVTILDPTCGSGAFLFAALNILEPLYTACLERMAAFVQAADATNASRALYSDFRATLEEMGKHDNRRYFILKSIIISNLYGVDIMEEATEIAKLRLFLKLVAQVDDVRRLEPLPDIDFNIRAGNTLVGFATLDAVRDAITRGADGAPKLLLTPEDEASLARINEQAEIVGRAYYQFHAMQTTYGMDAADFHTSKTELTERLRALTDELDTYLARDYRVDASDTAAFAAWRLSHRPFHWCVEFYGIVQARGGFDVIIGNPPWKEYAAVRKTYAVFNYQTEACGNLYGICTERVLTLRAHGQDLDESKPSQRKAHLGWSSFIVQLPLVNSPRMSPVRRMLHNSSAGLWTIPFDDRPGKLFEGLQNCRSTIFLSVASDEHERHNLFTAKYQRWATQVRDALFPSIEYVKVEGKAIYPDQFPKYASPVEVNLFARIADHQINGLDRLMQSRTTKHFVFYQEATRYWIKACVGLPYYSKNGEVGAPDHGRYLYVASAEHANVVCALLNSSTFYLYFVAYGDCFHLNDSMVANFPVSKSILDDPQLSALGTNMMQRLQTDAEHKTIRTKDGDTIAYDEYYGSKAKPIIDEIDRALAQHYGFTDEELDFIINYDIKYRMGQSGDDDEGGDE